jgi:type IV secretion system protein VirD4
MATLGSNEPDAIGLGRILDGPNEIGGKLRYGGERHVLVFGPNGSGKGMRLLVPNLLQCTGRSIFVIDPKGELAAMTAPFRRTLGPVAILNPFGVMTKNFAYGDLRSVGFNPLATLDPSLPSFNADASLLADALVKVEGKDPHWDASARALLAALIMYTAIEARERRQLPTMARVRELLCEAVEEPSEENHFRGAGLPARALEMTKSSIAGLRNKASQFVDWTNEIRSIASAAKRQTEMFDDDEIAADLALNGCDLREMKRRPMTVYLILPPEMMDRHSKWLRLVLTAALRATLRARERGEPKVLFMLDEFAALGHLQIIETVWALVRGYGIQIMPVLQDINQLKSLYRERWETFIGMAGAVASFGPNDLTTAKWLSDRAGETTRVVSGFHQGSGESTGGQGSMSSNQGTNYQQVKVPLMPSHTLYGMPTGTMLVTLAGLSNVVPAYAPGYWEIQQCRERARQNPYY